MIPSSRRTLYAVAVPGLAMLAAAQSDSVAIAIPVLLRGDWSSKADTSSDNPEEWLGRFDVDIADWLCRYCLALSLCAPSLCSMSSS